MCSLYALSSSVLYEQYSSNLSDQINSQKQKVPAYNKQPKNYGSQNKVDKKRSHNNSCLFVVKLVAEGYS